MGKSALPTVNNYEGFFLFKGVYLLLEFSLDLVNWQVQMWVKLKFLPTFHRPWSPLATQASDRVSL